MNPEIFVGRLLQLGGKLFEAWGRLTDNDIQRQRGYQLVCVGQMRVLGGQAMDLLRYCTPRQALTAHPAPLPPRR